jgi:hypothetical protein
MLYVYAELCKRERYGVSVVNSITNKERYTKNIKLMKNMINDCVAGNFGVYYNKVDCIGTIQFDYRVSHTDFTVYPVTNTAYPYLKDKMELLHKEVLFFKNIGFFENGTK